MDLYCFLCGEPHSTCPGDHSIGWAEVAAIIRDETAPEVSERVVEILRSGEARWIWDPQHEDDVAGLVKPGTDYALMIVYVASSDFETALDFFGDDGA